MKINELRIGSWVLYEGKPKQITPTLMSILLENLVDNSLTDMVKPLPITEDILKSIPEMQASHSSQGYFNITTQDGECYVYCNVSRKKDIYGGVAIEFVDDEDNRADEAAQDLPLKYVHELQNLVLAITGVHITLDV
jgi:hypothetical protein